VPRVSVCIPTYNTARYLAEAIESVLGQEYADYELVICDNASTDGTPDICRRYTDPRVRTVRFEQLVGQAANWNRCVELATGELVVLLHADDRLAPRFLSRAVRFVDAHPEVGMVHCAVQHFSDEGDLYVQRLHATDRVEPGEDLFRRLLHAGCVVNPAGVLVRKEVYRAAGPFAEDIVWCVDWHMWLRIALKVPVGYLAEPLAFYRQHGQSGTTGVMATGRNGTDELWALDDVFRQVPVGRQDLHRLYAGARYQVAHRTWCHAEEACRRGHLAAARAGVRKAVRISPVLLLRSRTWGLLAASYLGYGWFERLRSWKRRALSSAVPPPSASY
jgi:glycosyltransferase involved in cell wall biosynthesis